MLPILQCAECKFNAIWKPEIIDSIVCEEYPEGIPNYVEEGVKDCPKFIEKET